MVFYVNFQLLENKGTVGLKTMSVTDDVIYWPLPNKILGCATDADFKKFINFSDLMPSAMSHF